MTKVFLAPGTPVTKQIDFLELSLDDLIIEEIDSDVCVRFIALPSFLEISET